MDLTPQHINMLRQASETGTFDSNEKALVEHAERANELRDHGYLDSVKIHRFSRDGRIGKVVIQSSELGRRVVE